jgi:hypothetical protein
MRSGMASLLLAVSAMFACEPSLAGETVRHDRRVERAAAQIAAAKIGDLRGGHSHDADPAALIERFKRPLRLRETPPAQPNAIPPLVMNEGVRGEMSIDLTVTGSVRMF